MYTVSIQNTRKENSEIHRVSQKNYSNFQKRIGIFLIGVVKNRWIIKNKVLASRHQPIIVSMNYQMDKILGTLHIIK